MAMIQLIGIIWIASAILIAVIQNVVFMHWLKKQGVRIVFVLGGTPWYLDSAYRKWCKSRGRSPRRILTLRAVCLANAIVAAIVFIMVYAK